MDPRDPQVGEYIEFNISFGEKPNMRRTVVKVDNLLTLERENLETKVKVIEEGVTRLFWEKLVKRANKED